MNNGDVQTLKRNDNRRLAQIEDLRFRGPRSGGMSH